VTRVYSRLVRLIIIVVFFYFVLIDILLLHTFAMMLSLTCYLLGDDINRYFIVEIEETESVSILKDLIKEKKAHHLDHVAASDLDIWKVDLPITLLKKSLDELSKLDDNNSLLPDVELSEVFGAPAHKHVHVIIKLPSVDKPG
jgi:hypothetical protein